MNAHVSTDEQQDLEQWLEDTVACEFVFNDSKGWHPQDAEWRGFGKCPRCDLKRSVMLCTLCKDYMEAPGWMHCSSCGIRKSKSDFFTRFITL